MSELSTFFVRLVDAAVRFAIPIRLLATALALALLLALRTVWKKELPLTQLPRHTIRALPFTVLGLVIVVVLVVLVFPGLVPEARVRGLCDDVGYIGNPQTHLYYPPGEDLPLLSPREVCFDAPSAAEDAGYRRARN